MARDHRPGIAMSRWVFAECTDCHREIRMRDLGLARLIATAWTEFHEFLHRPGRSNA